MEILQNGKKMILDKKALNYIAYLESKVDMMEAELCQVDKMLRDSGFPEGISTLKEILGEIYLESSFEG